MSSTCRLQATGPLGKDQTSCLRWFVVFLQCTGLKSSICSLLEWSLFCTCRPVAGSPAKVQYNIQNKKLETHLSLTALLLCDTSWSTLEVFVVDYCRFSISKKAKIARVPKQFLEIFERWSRWRLLTVFHANWAVSWFQPRAQCARELADIKACSSSEIPSKARIED